MALKCPKCRRKLKYSAWSVILRPITVRCECGTRVTIAPGFWKDQVIDWETPAEREGKQ